MNIVKIPLTKIEDVFGSIGYELPHGIVLGHDGENLTTEIQIYPDEILGKAEYYLEMNNVEGLWMEKHDDYLSYVVGAEVLTTGDLDVQLSWSWIEVNKDGKEEILTDKSRVAKWRVLDSVKLDEALQKACPEIIAKLIAKSSKNGIELRYNSSTNYVEWRYLDEEEWFEMYTPAEGSEGKSAYQVAVKNGFKGSEAEWLESLHGKDGKDGENGKDGVDGRDGQNGLDGKDGKDGTNGIDGKNGEDGFSPEITVEETETGVSFTITRKDAESQTVVVYNGKNGADGKDGINGKDGTNGIDGKDGQNGQDGKDGENYVITDADYQAIANIVLAQFVDGDNLTY